MYVEAVALLLLRRAVPRRARLVRFDGFGLAPEVLATTRSTCESESSGYSSLHFNSQSTTSIKSLNNAQPCAHKSPNPTYGIAKISITLRALQISISASSEITHKHRLLLEEIKSHLAYSSSDSKSRCHHARPQKTCFGGQQDSIAQSAVETVVTSHFKVQLKGTITRRQQNC